jgi:2-polyprenyl-3-methyl-5-hydroxy-6-metoxy-1,4-benzoquinol methylase
MPPFLSAIARRKKVQHFFKDVPKTSKILEIGCGDKWLGHYLAKAGWTNYTGLDIVPPADIIGDIRDWRNLNIPQESFDVIAAFEVIEHVECFKDLYQLLKTNGYLFLTSPRPELDWFCKILENIRLTQKRSSPHAFLINFRNIPYFYPIKITYMGLVSQWGIFRKS